MSHARIRHDRSTRAEAPQRGDRDCAEIVLPNIIQDDEAWFDAARTAIARVTTVAEKRLRSLHALARAILQAHLNGDFVVCGAATGGPSALLAACLRRYGASQQRVWCFDTFTDLPAPERRVREAARIFGAEQRLVIRAGQFQETLTSLAPRIGRISLLHLEEDSYEATKVCFEQLWDYIAPSGAIQVGRYGESDDCRRAIDDFLACRGMTATIERIDNTDVAFRKPTEAEARR